jgi:hypothetical protein
VARASKPEIAARHAARNGRCPSITELLGLLEKALGTRATRKHLAELVGCSALAVIRWERGTHFPSPAYRPRLLELERRLRERGASLGDELRGAAVPATTPASSPTDGKLPLVADVIGVKVEGGRALLTFGLAIPGEREPRSVAEVLVPLASLERAMKR